MVFGARPIGSRTLGDATGDAGSVAAVVAEDIAASGSIDIDGTVDVDVIAPEDIAMSGSIDIDGTLAVAEMIDLFLEPAQVVFSASVTIPPQGSGRATRIVDPDGSSPKDLVPVVQGPITWELNKPVAWSFECLVDDAPAVLALADEFQEVQLWRGDMLLTWGPMVRPQQTLSRLTVQGNDCLWYLGRRNIGRAERTNYLLNPSFENGLASWDVTYLDPSEGNAGRNPAYVLGAISSARSVTGQYSLRVELPDDTYPEFGGGAKQNITWEVDAAAKHGDVWSVSVMVYVPSADLRSVDGAHIRLGRFSTTELVSITSVDGVYTDLFPLEIETVSQPITPDFPRDVWSRVSLDMEQPVSGDPEYVQVDLYGVRGITFFDQARLSYNERLEFFSTDQALIVQAIVEHLQDAAFDKSDLNIDTLCPLTGVLRDATYLFEDHVNGLRAITDFTTMDDGVDVRMQYTPTTRTLVTSFPAEGAWRPNVPLELYAQIGSYGWTFDGELAASAVVTLGEGLGSTREEGFATDPTAYANGLTLEEVFSAPPGSPVANLDNIASERLTVTTSPEVLEFKTLPDPELTTRLLGSLRVGDVLPVTIRSGALEIEGTRWRLVKLTLETDDSLSGVLNRRDVTS